MAVSEGREFVQFVILREDGSIHVCSVGFEFEWQRDGSRRRIGFPKRAERIARQCHSGCAVRGEIDSPGWGPPGRFRYQVATAPSRSRLCISCRVRGIARR